MTPYQKIIEEFLIKISQDKEYFVYGNRTEQEVNDIIEKRSIALLKQACNELNNGILEQVELSLDDTTQSITVELTDKEIDIISDEMKIIYMNEPLLKLKQFNVYLGTDIQNWSPANERKTYLEQLEYLQEKMNIKIDNYNAIDRETGKRRSIYDELF